MKWTIAIPTIVQRQEQFFKLYEEIKRQAKPFNDVEVIFIQDNKEISIGAKRQKLLEMAKGEYISMIDDDDCVSSSYVSEIRKCLDQNPDSVAFEIECEGTEGKIADMSNIYKDWADNERGYDYVRTPYQKTPMRTEIALKIGYKDMRYGEDYDFSKRLKQSGLIKKEVRIDDVMYFYRFKYENPKTKFNM